MSPWKKAFALTLLSAIPMTGYAACVSTWTGGLDGTWNQAANWSSCIPGIPVTATDSAAFGSTVGAASTISLDTLAITPGLNQLTFDNSATSFTIFSSSNFLQFNGAPSSINVIAGSHKMEAPIQLSNTQVNVSSSGLLTLLKPMTEAAASTSSIEVQGSGQLLNQMNTISLDGSISVLSGILTNNNTAAVAAGQGSLISVGQDFIVSGGNFAHTNSGAVTGGKGVALDSTQAFTFNAGTVRESNTNTVSEGTAIGADMECSTNLNMNGGTVTISNTGGVSNGGNGCFLGAPQVFINGGAVTLSNSGAITTQGAGSFFSVLNLTLSNGSLTNANTGSVAGNLSIGSFISAQTNITLNGGVFRNTHTGAVTANGIGALIEAGGVFAIKGGEFINDATVWTPTFNIGPAGTLAGNGLFQNISAAPTTRVANAGTIIPGDRASGVMTIQGSYSQSGTLLINLLNASTFSQLNVEGTGSFGVAQLGGNLDVAISSGAVIEPGQTFAIVQASNGVIGTFGRLNNLNIPNLLPHVQYFPNSVLLSFTPVATTYLNYLETLFATNNHLNIRLVRQMGQLRSRFSKAEKVSPERREEKSKRLYFMAASEPSLQEVFPQLTAQAALPTQDQLAFARFRPTEEKQEQLRGRLAAPLEPCQTDRPWNFYLGPTGDLGHVFTKKDAGGFGYWSAGALTGFDYAFSEVGIGLLLSYDHIAGHGAHHWGNFDINELHANLYATYAPKSLPPLAVNAILGGGYDWYDIQRHTGLPAAPETAKGTPRGTEFDTLLGLEYAIKYHRLQVIPQASLQYVHLNVKQYREHGTDHFDLQFARQTAKSLRSTLGARVNYCWSWKKVAFTPELNLGWQREFFDKSRPVRFTPVDFDVSSASLIMPRSGRDVALAGIDFLVTLFDRYGLEASYDFEWNRLYHDHFFYVGCNFHY
ncbi:MAG: autotransporter domain-containing protein [Verrucomicrobia bacterium]|nr:autotransporter domain-containing protein [Verrucomicrobiota bacterium]